MLRHKIWFCTLPVCGAGRVAQPFQGSVNHAAKMPRYSDRWKGGRLDPAPQAHQPARTKTAQSTQKSSRPALTLQEKDMIWRSLLLLCTPLPWSSALPCKHIICHIFACWRHIHMQMPGSLPSVQARGHSLTQRESEMLLSPGLKH